MREEWELFQRGIAASQVDELPRPELRPASSTSVPMAGTRQDRLALPNGVPWQRSSFWLNQGYLQELVGQEIHG